MQAQASSSSECSTLPAVGISVQVEHEGLHAKKRPSLETLFKRSVWEFFGFHIQSALPLRAATTNISRSGAMPPSTTATAQFNGSRGGPASAATLSDAEFEAFIGPGSSQHSHVAPSLISPQTSYKPNQRPHLSSSHTLQQPATTIIPTTTDHDSNHSPVNLDISTESQNTRKDLLRESFFPGWKNDAAGAGLANPAEMQKQDPLATQIWKLYSKTKTQLPNQERMENLTWRMMAMNLKRKEREQARYELQHHKHRPRCGA